MKTFCLSFIFIFSISLSAQDTFNKRITLGYHYTNFTGIVINDTSIFCAGIYVDTILPYPEGSFLYEMNLEGNVIKEYNLGDSIGKRHVWQPFLHWKNDTTLLNIGYIVLNGGGFKGLGLEYDILNEKLKNEYHIGNIDFQPNGVVYGFDKKLKAAISNGLSNGNVRYSFATINDDYTIKNLSYLNGNSNRIFLVSSLAKGTDKYFMGLLKSNRHLVDKYFQLSNLIIVLDSTDQKILQYETSGHELWLAPQWIEPTADGGILVAANKGEEKHFENSRFGVVLMQPAVYKLNYDSAENKLSKTWEKVFGNEQETANHLHRINKIIPITPEKKEFIAIGQQATGAFIGKGFMVKFTEDGDSLWRREYEFLTEDHREHMINDIVPIPDGGYYLCGLISDFSRDTTNLNPPYHRGWLMKVDEHGCLIPGCEQTSATEDFKEDVSVLLYPNPATEFLNFQIQNLKSQKKLTCRILDNQGKVVKNLKDVNGGTTYFTPVHDLANGIYFLQIFEGNSLLHSAKFLKQ